MSPVVEHASDTLRDASQLRGLDGRSARSAVEELLRARTGDARTDNGHVISIELAKRLRAAGVRWNPAPGDRFVIPDRDMDDQVFVLADMTVDVHEFPTGRVLGFNGTVEWALDSVDQDVALWLPSETQLRERLGGTFVSMSCADGGFEVVVDVSGRRTKITEPEVDAAYGRALLLLATGE
jgi:translation initiation factor IF-1